MKYNLEPIPHSTETDRHPEWRFSLPMQPDVAETFQVEKLRTFRNSAGMPYAVVSHNARDGLMSDMWLGGFNSDAEFRAVLEFICEQFETGDYNLWLADLRLLNTSFFQSDAWLAETVFPRVVAAGLRREAVVLPTVRSAPAEYDVFGSASSALRKITDQRVRGFEDIVAARDWLFEEPA